MENKSGKTLSMVSMILGIVSVVLAWVHWILAIVCLICGIVAIVLSVKGKKACVEAGEPTGMATAGLVLGIIGVVLSGIAVLCLSCITATACAAFGAAKDAGIESDVQGFFNSLQ